MSNDNVLRLPVNFRLGTYDTQKQHWHQKKNLAIKSIDMRVAGINGGISGGTYASLSNVIEDSYKDKNIYKILYR